MRWFFPGLVPPHQPAVSDAKPQGSAGQGEGAGWGSVLAHPGGVGRGEDCFDRIKAPGGSRGSLVCLPVRWAYEPSATGGEKD